MLMDFPLPDRPPSNWAKAGMQVWENLSFEDLSRLSLVTNQFQWAAALELRSRGYIFDEEEQKWHLTI